MKIDPAMWTAAECMNIPVDDNQVDSKKNLCVNKPSCKIFQKLYFLVFFNLVKKGHTDILMKIVPNGL